MKEFITSLIELLYKNEMVLAPPKSIPTFQSMARSWTQPDNVWRCNTPDNPVARCDVIPAICPPLVDHLPVITILDLPFPRVDEPHMLNFRQANWIKVNEDLPAAKIRSKEQFILKVNELVSIIVEVLEDHLKKRHPSPFKHWWWTKELSQLKKQQNRPSSKAFKMQQVHNHPVHGGYKVAVNKFKEVMQETRGQDWMYWFKAASQQDLYIANKGISNEPTDYSSVQVPMLRTTTNNLPSCVEDTIAKSAVLVESFSPPPPLFSCLPLNPEYPMLLKEVRFFSRARIRQVICTLSSYKAPGPDKIPNVVLIKCCDVIIDYLFYVFRAVFEHNVYHP